MAFSTKKIIEIEKSDDDIIHLSINDDLAVSILPNGTVLIWNDIMKETTPKGKSYREFKIRDDPDGPIKRSE